MKQLIKQIVESKFNFNIDIEGNENQKTLSKSNIDSASLKKSYEINQMLIDLKLPSNTIWTGYNLGCNFDLLNYYSEDSKPEDWYGNYYAWGETEPKKSYTWETYTKFCTNGYNTLTKYCDVKSRGVKDNLFLLLLEDDAAYQNMHFYDYKFCIPSKQLYEELDKYTIKEWVENYQNINGLNGYILTSKINGNKLFIPAGGYYRGDIVSFSGRVCLLWSSSLYKDDANFAWYIYINIYMHGENRYNGMNIRPILLDR